MSALNTQNAEDGSENNRAVRGDDASDLQQPLDGVTFAEGLGYAYFTRNRTLSSSNALFLDFLSGSAYKDKNQSTSEDREALKQPENLTLDSFIPMLNISTEGNKTTLTDQEVFDFFEILFLKAQSNESRQKNRLIATTPNGRYIRLTSLVIGPDKMLVTARDVTAHSQYRRLFDTSMQVAGAGFWSINFTTGKFTYSDSVLDRLTEDEVKKMKTMGVWAIVHPDEREAIVAQWQEVFKSGAEFDLKYRVVTEREGLMWQRTTGQLERSADGRVLSATGFVMDITQDVENQNKLSQEQETSQIKSNFLARMSHEIRTPLNAIIGMSDSLRDEDLSPDVRGVIDDIEDAAEGLNNLLSRTLDHSKLESNKMQMNFEAVNLRDMFGTCQRLWRPQITSKGLDFKVAFDPNLPETMYLDEFRIQQCVNNLLSNAVKFTSKGHIALIVKQAEVKGEARLVIAVKDQGIGMSPEETAHIFEDYTQAKESISSQFGGTGLGMSITKQLCELMGGKIVVKSEKGAGTTFILMLPTDVREVQSGLPNTPAALEPSDSVKSGAVDIEVTPASEAVPAIKAQDNTTEEKPFEGLNVLCVEDNQVNQKVVSRLIGSRVKQLHFANNGREGLDVLNTAHIDVVLMDIHMPVMDGIETTMEIRRSNSAYANVVIIALTADPDYQQKKICRNIGMDDTIGKPVRREDILNAFERNLKNVPEGLGQKIELTA